MILYINCCTREDSRTDRLARALLEELGDYEELRLYEEPLRPLEAESLARRDELLARKDYGNEMFRYARQFAAADTIVVAAPLWDLSFPSQLKVYIENIYVTCVVTRYDESGQPVGLCRGEKLYYVSTSGGPFDGRYGYEYLKSMATECFGISSVELVTAEGLDIWGNDPEAILQRAIEGLADGK